MPHTYCTNLIHCVFSTKDRADLIAEGIQERLYAYIFGIARKLEIEILALGGTANHIHVLMALPAKHSLSTTVRNQIPRAGCRKTARDFRGRKVSARSASAPHRLHRLNITSAIRRNTMKSVLSKRSS